MKISDLTCPSCAAVYKVAESSSHLGRPGRVECTNCGQLLDSWSQNVRADRSKEMQNWTTLDASFEALRAKLDRLRDSYDDREINDAMQPVILPPGRPLPPYTLFHSLDISIEAFLAQLRGIGDPVPESVEDDLRAQAGLILRDLNRLAKWKSDTKNISGVRVNELSIADPARQPFKQLTQKPLIEYFKTDFPNLFKTYAEVNVDAPGIDNPRISIQAYYDFQGRSSFVGYYIPMLNDTYQITAALADASQTTLQHFKSNITMDTRDPADVKGTTLADLTFTGAVYVYHEKELDLQQLAALDKLYASKSLFLQLRGHAYAATRWLQEEATHKVTAK